MRTILVHLSDTHGGDKRALMNPDVVLEEEDFDGTSTKYTPAPTAVQRYLWPLYLEHIAAVVDLAHGDDIFVHHNGDLCAGKKYPTGLVSTRDSDQILVADANLEPWLVIPNVKWMRIATGTDAHELSESVATLEVTRDLAKAHPDIDIQSATHGYISLRGIKVDYAHHGPYPGGREWLRGNIARLYLLDLVMRHVLDGCAPPDLVLRSHYHTPVHEYLDRYDHECHLFVSPSYTFLNEHAVQATRSEYKVTNGLWAFEITDGKLTGYHKFMATKDIRTKEVIL